MSKLEELIKQLCPNGVKYKRLDEVFKSFNGMTGVSNKWKENGNCQFIEYMNAYKNLKINIKLLPFATVKKLQQNTLQKGDILLTCASETPYECAVSSVIEDEIKDNVFLDDHLFGIRVKKDMKSEINTTFINYYMHTNNFRKKINKAVRGVTRFYISIDEFMKICIPVPPLEVQCEIVHILDDFTLLSAELSAELKARREQFNYYRSKLFEKYLSDFVELDSIGDVTKLAGFEFTKYVKYSQEGNIIALRGLNVKDGRLVLNDIKYIDNSDFSKLERSKLYKNDLLYTYVGTVGQVGLVDQNNKYYLAPNVARIRINNSKVLPKFVMYFLQTPEFKVNQLDKLTGASSMKNITMTNIRKFKIPLPSIEEQERIVNILDKFDKYCNNISEGLPAEIEARQKQYEYYRDKLLTFKELKVNE